MENREVRKRRGDSYQKDDRVKSEDSANQEDEEEYYRKLERRGRNMAVIIVVYMVLCVAVFLWFQLGRVPTPVLVLLVPGFRADYLKLLPPAQLPFLTEFSVKGSQASWLQPSFPAATLRSRLLPLVTGSEAWQQDSLTLWQSAVRQWRSVSLFGVQDGCREVDGYRIQECHPEHQTGGHNTALSDSLRRAAESLLQGKTNFALVQIESIRKSAEQHGSLSEKTFQIVRELDQILSLLSDYKQDGKSLIDAVNLLVISDGGTTDTTSKKRVSVKEFLPEEGVWSFHGGGGGGVVYTEEHHVQDLMAKLNSVTNVEARRFQSLDSAIMIRVANSSVLEGSEHSGRAGFNYDLGADEDAVAMRGVMMARGPGIRRGLRLPPISARDVYPLLAALLDITPELHSGSLSSTADMVIW